MNAGRWRRSCPCRLVLPGCGRHLRAPCGSAAQCTARRLANSQLGAAGPGRQRKRAGVGHSWGCGGAQGRGGCGKVWRRRGATPATADVGGSRENRLLRTEVRTHTLLAGSGKQSGCTPRYSTHPRYKAQAWLCRGLGGGGIPGARPSGRGAKTSMDALLLLDAGLPRPKRRSDPPNLRSLKTIVEQNVRLNGWRDRSAGPVPATKGAYTRDWDQRGSALLLHVPHCVHISTGWLCRLSLLCNR